MGLDMYLFKRKKYKNLANNDREEVAYWRKANQIRRWFVENTDLNDDDNCRMVPLSKDILEKLLKDCKDVLANKDLADSVMPTEYGFWFGSTEYNDGYFYDLENTIKQVERVINETDFENEVIEYSDWW